VSVLVLLYSVHRVCKLKREWKPSSPLNYSAFLGFLTGVKYSFIPTASTTSRKARRNTSSESLMPVFRYSAASLGSIV